MMLKKALFILCISASSLALAANIEIYETRTIEKVLPHIDQSTWFVVDLDNTLFQATQALGHVDWLQAEVRQRIEEGLSREDAFHSIYPLWKQTQRMTEVMPVEERFIEALAELQESDIKVMGLTHRQLFIIPETLHQLDSIGVSFKQSAPSQETFSIEAPRPALYQDGVLFVDDFNTKGDVFRAFLSQSGLKPSKIVFVDDKRKNVEELSKVLMEEGIDIIGFHYTAVEEGERIYTPERARCQRDHMHKILSNHEADLLLSLAQEEPATPWYLYKILSVEAWEESLHRGKLQRSSMDEWFIHLATAEQMPRVVQKYWQGREHVTLKIDVTSMRGRLEYESNPGGSNKYFHLYDGEIALQAITEVKRQGGHS